MAQEEIKKYILEHYQIKTESQIAVELKCDIDLIRLIKNELGLFTRQERNNFLRSKTKYICDNYFNKTKAELAEELHCSASFIKKIWHENEMSKKNPNKTKYYTNSDIFSSIKTAEQSYWLGYIAADGCIFLRDGHQGMLALACSSIDIELIENFKKFANSTMPYHTHTDNRRPTTQMVNLQITNNTIVNRLIELGLKPKKTWEMDLSTLLINIPSHLHWSFYLGYFDGDGHIDPLYDNVISKTKLNIVAPLNSLFIMQEDLLKVGIQCEVKEDKTGKYTQPFGTLVFLNTTQKYCFLKYMYQQDIPCLQRKKERAIELIRRIELNTTNRAENLRAIQYYQSVVVKWEELRESCDANPQPSL